MTGTLHEEHYTVLNISRSVLLGMRNVAEESCRESQNTYFMFGNIFFENHVVNEIMWKNVVGPGRPQMTIWRMHIACWINKSANTHSQYAILIAFPPQQWLHEHVSLLRYTYIACLVFRAGLYGWDLNDRSSDDTPLYLTKGKIKCMGILCKMLPRVTHRLFVYGCAQLLVPVCKIVHCERVIWS